MQETFVFQRRNRLKKHFVNTSNVLLYCYELVSDAAKITFQIVDGFDWEDHETGESKGYVYPAVETLALIRKTSVRTIQRHIQELIEAKLLTRFRRRNKPSVLYIEEVTEIEITKYFDIIKPKREANKSRNDKNVVSHMAPETTKMSFAYSNKKDENKENEINVNENLNTFKTEKRQEVTRKTNRGGDTKSLRDLLIHYDLQTNGKSKTKATLQGKTKVIDKEKRNYLASEIADKLNDQKSLGAFRTIAERVPESVIFEVLSSIKETAREGKIRVSGGALFINIIKGYCASHGIELGFSTKELVPDVVGAQRGILTTS